MKKMLIVVSLLFISGKCLCQENKNQKLQYSSELLSSRIKQLGAFGYEIMAAKISQNFGALEIQDYDLITNKVDSVFTEAYVIYTNGGYGIMPGAGLTITKSIVSKGEKNNSKIEYSSVEQFVKLNAPVNTYRFKSYFKPALAEKNIDYKTSYKFNIELIMQDEGYSIGSKDFGKAIVLIVYVKTTK